MVDARRLDIVPDIRDRREAGEGSVSTVERSTCDADRKVDYCHYEWSVSRKMMHRRAAAGLGRYWVRLTVVSVLEGELGIASVDGNRALVSITGCLGRVEADIVTTCSDVELDRGSIGAGPAELDMLRLGNVHTTAVPGKTLVVAAKYKVLLSDCELHHAAGRQHGTGLEDTSPDLAAPVSGYLRGLGEEGVALGPARLVLHSDGVCRRHFEVGAGC